MQYAAVSAIQFHEVFSVHLAQHCAGDVSESLSTKQISIDVLVTLRSAVKN